MDFLKAITAREAREIIGAFPIEINTEIVGIEDVQGRVLARDLVSKSAIPSFTRSLVDGYAVKAKDTQGAKETTPAFLNLKGEIRIGEEAHSALFDGEAIYVATGSMVPGGCDAIVMQEYARLATDAVEITRAVYQGENICYEGEDIAYGGIILKKGRKVTAFDRGVLAAIGAAEVEVNKAPQVALISSGDEIVSVDEIVPLGKVRDINRYTVSGLLRDAGAYAHFLGLSRDNIPDITEKLLSASNHSMILISGGSSKGERDFITTSIEKLGGTILFHGINIKPGKPAIFGQLFGKPIFGLPGHPGSCAMVTVRFVLPLVKRFQGEEYGNEIVIPARMTTNVPSTYGIEEYIRVTLKKDEDNRYCAQPIFSKSAVISPLAQADGYVVVSEGVEGIEKDETVEVYLFA
ncbi:MAG: molybdopterin molybdenumtransferase MoeA [Syntrophus sp. (in: bacteria)]|nr:molybdopterin molybdenumtransferase MoeA [Syntrophus sp. (in: bacteria)]